MIETNRWCYKEMHWPNDSIHFYYFREKKYLTNTVLLGKTTIFQYLLLRNPIISWSFPCLNKVYTMSILFFLQKKSFWKMTWLIRQMKPMCQIDFSNHFQWLNSLVNWMNSSNQQVFFEKEITFSWSHL